MFGDVQLPQLIVEPHPSGHGPQLYGRPFDGLFGHLVSGVHAGWPHIDATLPPPHVSGSVHELHEYVPPHPSLPHCLPLQAGVHVVVVHARPFRIATRNNSPELYSTHAVPVRSTLIENVVAPLLRTPQAARNRGRSRRPTLRHVRPSPRFAVSLITATC